MFTIQLRLLAWTASTDSFSPETASDGSSDKVTPSAIFANWTVTERTGQDISTAEQVSAMHNSDQRILVSIAGLDRSCCDVTRADENRLRICK